MEVGAESGCDREKGRVCRRAEFSILDTKRGEEGSGTPGGSPLPPLSLHLGPRPFGRHCPHSGQLFLLKLLSHMPIFSGNALIVLTSALLISWALLSPIELTIKINRRILFIIQSIKKYKTYTDEEKYIQDEKFKVVFLIFLVDPAHLS